MNRGKRTTTLSLPLTKMGRATRVTFLYRKPRPTGNFSIETSFDQMLSVFPREEGWEIEKVVSSYYSNGLIPRLRAIREVARLRSDVYHITGDVHFLAFGLPGKRTVITIHDCGFLSAHRGMKSRLLKAFWLDCPTRLCHTITAVSEATRQDILRHTGCDPAKVRVIPTVIARHFRRSPRRPLPERPCILHIGLAGHKNFRRHVEALSGLPCQLRIIGKLQPMHHQWLRQHNIAYTHAYNLSEEEMQRAYEHCDLLLFASTLEGFGMPIVEAQTVGRPVVTSTVSSMPEVAGDAACLVDPCDVAAIRAGVLRVIQDAAFREELVRRGFENVRRFRPEAVARQYAELYAEMLRD